MRIHTIRLANLNALAGEWEIDLDHPAYADNIYALTGPTGAGKTTLLDAISLALYGRTPRLERIGKAGNETMSRHSGHCHAEITFSTRAGRYRSHWSQHRARRKAGGELQNPKHELADAASGEILATGLKDTAAAIEKLTGMDYQRFTRAMLLAQGDFAAFLRAAPDERAPLLEQITGTAIYSRISIAVHDRLRAAQEQERALALDTAGITPLDADTLAALTADTAALQEQLAVLETRQQQTAAALTRAQQRSELHAERDRLADEQTAHEAALARFAPERARLARAQQAALLDADYARLDTLRRAQQQDHAALAALDEKAPALAAARESAQQQHAAARARVAAEKQRLAAAQPAWQQTRAHDHTLRHQREQLAALEQHAAAHAAAQSARQKAETAAAAAQQKAENASRACTQAESALAAHLADRLLREYRAEKDSILRELAYHQRIADLEQQRAQLHDGEPCPLCGATDHPYAQALPARPDDLNTRLAALETYLKQAEQLETAYTNAQTALTAARTKQQQAESAAALAAEKARNTAAYAAQLAALQNAHAQTRAARRAILGERDPDAEEAAQQRTIAAAETAAEHARSALQQAENRVAANQQQREQLRRRLTDQRTALDQEEQHFAAALRAIPLPNETAGENSPSPVGEGRGGGSEPSAPATTLTFRETEAEEPPIDLLPRGRESTKNATAFFVGTGGGWGWGQQTTRTATAGTITFADEATALRVGAEPADRSGNTPSPVGEGWGGGSEPSASATAKTDSKQPLEWGQQTTRAATAGTITFTDEAAWQAARLPAAAREALAREAAALDQQTFALRTRQQDCAARLAALTAQSADDADAATLQARQQADNHTRQQQQQALAEKHHRLSEHERAVTRLAARQNALAKQQQETRRWQDLHALIGAADGKKYRNYAQSLTFASVIAHANRQLAQLSDRYLLTADPARPLEANIIDNYQGGEIRSAKNLSGGESFIVSLALALGLAQMSGETMQVDSLFLDEGFGTLDEETLDSALETLAQLRTHGKHIGIISHVAALTERIATRITVTPQPGGTSTLSGPGCRRIQ